MALEDSFIEADIQDLDQRFSRIDREFAVANKQREQVFAKQEDDPTEFGFTDDSGGGLS